MFKVEYSSFVVAAIVISLGFSIFLTTILLNSIQKNKKPLELDAREAVSKTLKINLWIVTLSVLALSFVYLFNVFRYDSNTASDFLHVTLSGLIMSFINGMLLLPLYM